MTMSNGYAKPGRLPKCYENNYLVGIDQSGRIAAVCVYMTGTRAMSAFRTEQILEC